MREYNELTKELLAQGYDENHYPDYVKLPGGVYGKSQLENLYGGFEYTRIYAEKFVYKTGCGLFVKGSEVISDFYCGKNHSHENNNPVVRCPFNKAGNCEKSFDCVHEWCECHRTEEPYQADFCLEKERMKKAEHIKEKYRQFSEQRNGRVCENHMRYDEKTDSVIFAYRPYFCTTACYHPNFCPILQKQLDKKKGNVFYDVKKIYPPKEQKTGQISLFNDTGQTVIEKGKKVFKSPISMDIAQAYVKVQSKELEENFRLNNSFEWFANPEFSFEIMNIRAEKKETRDIFQDIADIKEGAVIIHESDAIENKKIAKRERRDKAKEQKKNRLAKKIRENGELSFEEQRAIEKLFDDVEVRRLKSEAKPKEEQLRLF